MPTPQEIGEIMRQERLQLDRSLVDAAAELGCMADELRVWEDTGIPVSEQRKRTKR